MNPISMRPLLLSMSSLGLASLATAQWTQVMPVHAPAPRIEPAMAYDSSADRTVLFGGLDTAGFSGTNYDDTWLWDGTDWTQLNPASRPPARHFAGMAYDVARGRTVLYGGKIPTLIGASYRDDTWEFDGTNWTQVMPLHSPGSLIGNPSGVGEVAMAYDVIGQRIVLFGGEIWGGYVPAPAATLEYDGVDWVKTTPAVEPPQRAQAAMCSAPSLGGVLMFGGTNFNNPPGPGGVQIWNDAWVYSSLTDTWTQLTVAGPVPTARAGASLLLDANTGLYVLHGGYTYSSSGMIQPLADTWVFDGISWTDVTATFGGPAGPHIRFASADGPNGCHVMFGGAPSVFGTVSDETWLQGCAASANTFGSGCAGSFGTPALAPNNTPALGAGFDLTVSALDPAAVVALLAFGFDDSSSVLGPLPASLQSFGLASGCNLLVSADATFLVGASGGVAGFQFAVPSGTAFLGTPLFFQAGSIDPGVPGGLAVSNGVAGRIGF